MRARRLLAPFAVAAAGLASLGACERVEVHSPAPRAEFIVAAADSSFWVRSDDDGIRVRGAPLTLAVVEGHLVELYLTDVDHSFYDAVYVGQRLIRRDLVSGDSMVLFADTLVPVLARAYAAANPDERPLAEDEEGSASPRTIATAEIIVLGVHGPYLSFEYRTDIDVIGGSSAHGARRGVVDLRTGEAATVEALFGAAEGRRVVALGRARWRAVRDSLGAGVDGRSNELRDELDRLGFDPRSFAIAVEDREPAVRFSITQSAARNTGRSFQLEAIDVEEPAWWRLVRQGFAVEELPGERTWPRGPFSVVARDTSATAARVALALRDRFGTEWRLGSVPSPVLRVLWVDDSLPDGTRAALAQAFDAAAFLGPDVRIVQGERPARGVRGPPVRLAFAP